MILDYDAVLLLYCGASYVLAFGGVPVGVVACFRMRMRAILRIPVGS